MEMKVWRRVLPLLVSLWFAAPAQRVTSDILGTITDPSGAVIAGASITVIHTETGQSKPVETNEEGFYRVSGLMPGTYQIRVTREGFQTQVLSGVVLEVNQQAQVDATLALKTALEQIEVKAQARLLETSTSELSSVVGQSTLRELPLNGRDLFQLTLLQNGVFPTTNAGPNPFAEARHHPGCCSGRPADHE